MGLFDSIGAGLGDVLGGITGANAAADAQREGARLSADATVASTEKNIDFSKWLWGEQKDLLQPFADAGVGALGGYKDLLEKPLDPFEDPGYQFGMNEGTRARENSASSRGMQLSGTQQKAMQRFGNDYGSTKWGETFSRRQTGLDNLYRMIAMGSNASAGQATAGTNMGNQVSRSINTAGQSMSDMYTNMGNTNAAQSLSGFNTLMDVGNLGATLYGAR